MAGSREKADVIHKIIVEKVTELKDDVSSVVWITENGNGKLNTVWQEKVTKGVCEKNYKGKVKR